MSLTTTSRLKLDLSISTTDNDSLLNSIILEASAACESYCNRSFASSTYSETVWADGTPNIIVSNTPVTTLTSIAFNGSTINSDLYSLLDANAGIIVKPTGFRDTRIYKQEIVRYPLAYEELYTVKYTAGYILPASSSTRTLPYDIERACIETAKQFYQSRCREGALESEDLGTYSATYREFDLPQSTKYLLNPYRKEVAVAI